MDNNELLKQRYETLTRHVIWEINQIGLAMEYFMKFPTSDRKLTIQFIARLVMEGSQRFDELTEQFNKLLEQINEAEYDHR